MPAVVGKRSLGRAVEKKKSQQKERTTVGARKTGGRSLGKGSETGAPKKKETKRQRTVGNFAGLINRRCDS